MDPHVEHQKISINLNPELYPKNFKNYKLYRLDKKNELA